MIPWVCDARFPWKQVRSLLMAMLTFSIFGSIAYTWEGTSSDPQVPLPRYKGHGSRVQWMRPSANGRTLLTICREGELCVWDVPSGKLLWSIADDVELAWFSQSEDRIVVVKAAEFPRGWAHSVISHDSRTGRQIGEPVVLRADFSCCTVVSSDGAYLATATMKDRNDPIAGTEVAVWSVHDGSVISRMEVAESRPTTIAWCDMTRKTAVGFADGSCILLDLAKRQKEREFKGQTGHVCSLVISGDGRYLASVGEKRPSFLASRGETTNGAAILWDIKSGRVVRRLSSTDWPATSVAIAPNGSKFSVGFLDGTIRVWDRSTEGEESQFKELSPICSVLFLSSGRHVLTGSINGYVTLWDVQKKQVIRRFGRRMGAAHCLAFSPDGRKILAGYAGVDGLLWDTKTGRVLHVFRGENSPISCVAFSPSGDKGATGHGTRLGTHRESVHIWNINSGEQITTLPGCRAYGTPSINFSRDGEHVLVGCSMFKLKKREEKWAFEIGSGHVNLSRISRDGRWALFGGWCRDGHHSPTHGFVAVCDASPGRYESVFWGCEADQPFDGDVLDACFCLDSNEIVVLTDKYVRRWNWLKCELVHSYRVHPDGFVRSLCVSHSGKKLLVGLSNNDAELWDIDTGKILQRFHGHSDCITCTSFSPDDSQVLTGSKDESLILWDTNSGSIVRRYCSGVPVQRDLITDEKESDSPKNSGENDVE